MQANKSNTVKRTLDLNNPPPLAGTQMARLDAVATMPDEQIDYSDAPYLPDVVWKRVTEIPSPNEASHLED